jgi:cytochrome c oxidase assembly protein subunit 11
MATASPTVEARNRRVGMIALLGAAAMLGLGYASVPLYRMFCQVTGFAGTTQRATEAEASKVAVSGKTMSIRFDTNVERGMPWKFLPVQATDTVSVGARDMAIFTAKNLSSKPITGTATFNVEPEAAGKYFNKIQCFCFTEQTLHPGQEVRMPVIYYVDPKIKDDPDAKGVGQITLSYTFHVLAGQASKGLDQAPAGG